MKNGFSSSQFWLTVGTLVVASALLLTGKVSQETWKWIMATGLGGVGIRKALEHFGVKGQS